MKSDNAHNALSRLDRPVRLAVVMVLSLLPNSQDVCPSPSALSSSGRGALLSGLFVGSVAHKVWHGARAHPSHQCIDWSLSGMSPWGQRTGHDAHAECGRKITPDVAGIFVLNLGPFRIIRETIEE